MRLVALLVIASASLAAIPLASADQSVDAGPAHVDTVSYDGGDGCEAGDNGYSSRSLIVHVDDPRAANGYKEVAIMSQCQAYSSEWGSASGSYLYVYAYSQEYGTAGPSVGYGWYGWAYGDGSQQCGSSVSFSGVAFQTGCPSPDGSSPPLLPALP